jgi:hypothetical protein
MESHDSVGDESCVSLSVIGHRSSGQPQRADTKPPHKTRKIVVPVEPLSLLERVRAIPKSCACDFLHEL